MICFEHINLDLGFRIWVWIFFLVGNDMDTGVYLLEHLWPLFASSGNYESFIYKNEDNVNTMTFFRK